MARRKFAKLKALMFERDVRQADLVPIIGRGTTYISTRLNGKEPWNTEDMQAVGELLEIPREQWLDYFIDSEGCASSRKAAKGIYSPQPRSCKTV